MLHWSVEEGQSVPVLKIPALPAQVLSVNLHLDQTITIPLKRGQTVSITTPVETLEQRMAKSHAPHRAKPAAKTDAAPEKGDQN